MAENGIDFFEKVYFESHERHKEYHAQAGFVFTLITVLSGLLFYLFNNPPVYKCGYINVLFWVVVIPSFLLLFLSVYFVWEVIKSKSFRQIANPHRYYMYLGRLRRFHRTSGNDFESLATHEFLSNLERRYAWAGEVNQRVLRQEESALSMAKMMVFFSAILCIIGFILYMFNPPKNGVTRVEITNCKGVMTLAETNNSQSNAGGQGQQGSSSSGAERPTAPQNITVQKSLDGPGPSARPVAPKNITVRESKREK